jgi:hypothetical protein
MRQFFWVIGISCLWAGSLQAAGDTLLVTQNGQPGPATIDFSTRPGSAYAWDLRWTGTEWVMTFVPNAVVVDSSSPTDAQLADDFVQLPTMRLTNIVDKNGYLTATLTPTDSLTIESYPGMANVLRATVGVGNSLVIGTTHVAYSQPQNDLTVISCNPDYGTVIPTLAADSAGGFNVDISFTGDVTGGVNLYELIVSNQGHAQGTLSGRINAIPEPATFAILGLGVLALARLRSRKLG